MRLRRQPLARGWLLGGALAVVSAPVGWFGTDALERDNDFCNACHLSEGVPLHRQIRRDFDATPPTNLAGLHASEPVATRPHDPAMRCVDCHGGRSFVGKARVKALAAKDAFWWLVGNFEEPDHMAWPLWDEDCTGCHAEFATKAAEYETPAFHDLSAHNVELGVDCVACHRVHESGGPPDSYFLQAQPVRAQCARCHSDFEETAS